MINYVHDDFVYYNGNKINYTCIYFVNGTHQYIFDRSLKDEEQQNIIDYITLYPFIV